jgi:signal transduction histidine kinase
LKSPPDLVLTDLQMPGIDGLEVCRQLKSASATRLVPVVMVTAMDSKDHRLAALDIGADDFLSKPVDRIELIARVRSLLRMKALMDQLEDVSLAKNEFIANMSHEMRQPLNSIIGFTDILLSKPDALLDQPRLHRFLTNIRSSGNHLVALIAGVLDLASIEARRLDLRITDINLTEVLESVGTMMQPMAELKGVDFRVDSGLPLVVQADAVRLRQIVLNLATNAVKFTPRGGLVTITTERTDEWVEFAVSDTGIGIGPEDRSRVFLAFTQVEGVPDREPGGSGLGLALVKQLTELHGGIVSLESELGKGSILRVRLPLTHPVPRPVADVFSGPPASVSN